MASSPSIHRKWEEVFCTWSAAPSEDQQTKCENAERMVRKAIAACPKLSRLNIEVFVQGSYCNRTNVWQDSDVDICVLFKDAFYTDYTFAPGLDDTAMNFGTSSYSYAEFKNDVEAALVSYFGARGCWRGSKAIDVHENTYRMDADVVPCFEYRLYVGNRLAGFNCHVGTRLIPDNGTPITNWPKQNYDNGVAKNAATGRQFKGVVRILKRLRNEMAENGHTQATVIPSYLIECMVATVPDAEFQGPRWQDNVRAVLVHLWSTLATDESAAGLFEINQMKPLFQSGQPWTRVQVRDFIQAAWNYIGLE